MDTKCLKRDSNNMEGGRRVIDRLSELPDEIIIAILTRLPLKEAAATSLLSSRWSGLWKRSPKLEFDTDTTVRAIDSVLESHKALSLNLFSISCHVDKSEPSRAAKWLDFVFSRRVEALKLNFQCNDPIDMLEFGKLMRERRVPMLFFKSLKRLCLECLKLSGEDVGIFIRNCPSLTHLTINSADFTSDVEIRGSDNLVLRYLDLLYSRGGKSIKIYAPNLVHVLVDQQFGKLVFENVPKLKTLRFRIKNPLYFVQHFACASSCFISKLHTLTLTLHHPEVFLWSGKVPRMPNLRVLIVRDHGVYEDSGLLLLTKLVWASPRLQEFVLKFFGDLKNAKLAIKKVKRSKHRHLKTFVFQGSTVGISDHVVELAAYLSKKCVALESVLIVHPLNEADGDREHLKLQLQGKLPKHIQVQFRANENLSLFLV